MKTIRLTNFIHVIGAMALLFGAAGVGSVSGATFVVTTTADSGSGSLRQAIQSANATATVADTINFNLPGTGPFTITALSPRTNTGPVTIDGYSQPGASANALANGDDAVLQIVVTNTLLIDATNSTVRGLAIKQIQIGLASGPKGNNSVEGCFVGLDATGSVPRSHATSMPISLFE